MHYGFILISKLWKNKLADYKPPLNSSTTDERIATQQCPIKALKLVSKKAMSF